MTAKCANPSCSEQFLYFRAGRIFLIDSTSAGALAMAGSRRIPEYFWLCGDCSRTMRVVLDRMGNVALEKLEAERPSIVPLTAADRPIGKRLAAHACD